ncbi:YggT family protein [Legionella israelensis]|uniref:YggT family protein n=1 Tax=Legionella israelensis TaxID=454 RepID=A0A0W0VXQ8_9GAMM|nr:YggT family protein [Legionella israelensis]KTD25031.1 YggT family protein [Legionella israelensis]QBS10601.1 YggT family protein [Legionella israelensis]SCY19366.1 YggT family protein [Legionella israelensis DSM 19235]STX57546.1 Integral membrane protein YggT, involved in response to extracytoplasmic stress (osmotic shock) [Legionella israelensis]
MSGFQAVGLFLVSIFFTLVIFSLWLRIAIRFFRISAINPASQIIYKITNPIVLPLNHIFNIEYKASNRYDWTTFAALVVVEFIKIIIVSLLVFGALIPFTFILVYVLADLIIQPCDLLFYIILIQVVLSWVSPALQHPVLDVIRIITAPFLNFGRKIIPDISGFDFSPFIILIILKVITLFINHSLPWRLL